MSKLSHFDSAGRPRMVDVGEKSATRRTARAHAFVRMSREVLAALPDNPKGDPLDVARMAGVMAAKRTPDLIPLCHSLPLSHADVEITVEADGVRIIARSRTDDYQYTHFHPGDCAGVLMSFDSVPGDANWRASKSNWPPAGPHWREHEAEAALGIAAVTIQSRDPIAACERWCMLLDRPAATAGEQSCGCAEIQIRHEEAFLAVRLIALQRTIRAYDRRCRA